jgi:hypothetical protein
MCGWRGRPGPGELVIEATTLAAALGRLPAQPVVHLDAGYDYRTCRQVLAERWEGRPRRRP